MTITAFTRGLDQINETDTYKAMMLGLSYVPDPSDEFVADIVGNEIASAGYARTSGFTLSRVLDDDRGIIYLVPSADPLVFGTLASNDPDPGCIVIYKHTGSDASANLIFAQTGLTALRSAFPNVDVSDSGLVRFQQS